MLERNAREREKPLIVWRQLVVVFVVVVVVVVVV